MSVEFLFGGLIALGAFVWAVWFLVKDFTKKPVETPKVNES